MARLIFIADDEDNREASKIEFEVPNDMDVWEYKRICIRMAGAMGYASLSIKKAFGHEFKTEQDIEIGNKLKSMYSGSYAL